ncbi:MerR family transcriptional regulator [Murimonas intestini]|uniref:MerR family transcriptional regulator n=1 Tax=Murimonas intestini TaxID=1337051 RepID=A0AB73T9T5_9FIRM|nr:MerR family transcriptional regulator [Murimonas intestini]MCR1839249.1 MerR family transcriptional regulator [Murimonas intestini]MCR1864545.1 MerR family transcriptional regulator [Murimonas intestini]MCR1882155.1 MerR family transcriptional regulator [Murimonas intestini]
MEYTILKLANLAGISTRTLRYYDEIGLLKPSRKEDSGYRVYGEGEVDRLQQILFYRELGLGLSDIKKAMDAPEYFRLDVLKGHLKELSERRVQLALLIENVEKTIQKEEGRIQMADQEKFMGLKRQIIAENEEKYGDEIRSKYGDTSVDESNKKMLGLTEEAYSEMTDTGERILQILEEAVRNQEKPEGEKGREAAELHKKWLTFTWPSYTKEAHCGVVQMYVADERFRAYYDGNMQGCAAFLKASVEAHVDEI